MVDRIKVVYVLIDKWFKEYNFLFTLTEDYNQQFLDFVYKIVDEYLIENNLLKVEDELIWGHIRYIIGNTYKKEIEIYKKRNMLTDNDKLRVREIITQYRPDLQKELLDKDSYIYDKIEFELQKNEITFYNKDTLERAWINVNISDPIPNLTTEVDILLEQHYPELKEEFVGFGIYSNILIEIGERIEIKVVYEKYNYFREEFFYTDEFSKALLKVVEDYLYEERHI